MTEILKLAKLTFRTPDGTVWTVEALPDGVVITLPDGYRFRVDGIHISDGWKQIALKAQVK
jgi:hypothetical protein